MKNIRDGNEDIIDKNFSTQVAVMAVWITSALYSAPKFIWMKTVTNQVDGITETICIADRAKHNSEILDMVSFALLYVMPLSVMTVSISKLISCRFCMKIFLRYCTVGLQCVYGKVLNNLRDN